MAPFHPLRREVRVFAARALAGVPAFCAIAFALLGASTLGPLDGVEAKEGAPGAEAVVAQVMAPPVDPAAPVIEPAPVPVEPAPVVEAPPIVEPPPAPEVEMPEPPPVEAPAPPPVEAPGPPVETPEDPSGELPEPPATGGGEKEPPLDPVKPVAPPRQEGLLPEPEPAPSEGRLQGRPGSGLAGMPDLAGGGGKLEVVEPSVPGLASPGQGTGEAPDSVPPSEAPGDGTVTGDGTLGSDSVPIVTDPLSVAPVFLGTERGAGGPDLGAIIVEAGPGGAGEGGSGSDGEPTDPGAPGGSGTGAVLGATALPSSLIAAGLGPVVSGDGPDAGSGTGGSSGNGGERVRDQNALQGVSPTLYGTVTGFFSYVPESFRLALIALAILCVLLALGYLFMTLRNRSLAKQRSELLSEVGLLQTALLPPVPERVGSLRTSVAYRPADGPGAGGDFYDVLPLAGGRVGFILGDVSGHGRGALARTAFMRYTLRAYLEAGLEPRVALQVAGRVIDENLGGDFATVLLAVHDPETGSLTYATAGHPAPLVVGPEPHEPVTAGSSPPIGVGVRTGLRQTTVPLVPGSVACLFTDGLLEARVEGGMLGRERLQELLDELGRDATAAGLIEKVRGDAPVLSDDIAAVVIRPTGEATAGLFRTEQLELTSKELEGPIAARFLESCGVAAVEVEAAMYDARRLAERFGGVILHVVFGNRLRVEVLPRNVESIEAASRRAAAH